MLELIAKFAWRLARCSRKLSESPALGTAARISGNLAAYGCLKLPHLACVEAQKLGKKMNRKGKSLRPRMNGNGNFTYE